MGGVAQEPGSLSAKPDDLEDEPTRVVFVAATATGSLGVVEPATQGAVGQGGQVRVVGRQDETDEVPAVVAVLPGRLARGRNLAGGQPIELGDVVDEHGEVVGVGEQLTLESRGQGREGRIELPEALLGRIV